MKFRVHESENSEKITGDIEVRDQNIIDLQDNGQLAGLYYDNKGRVVAKDIWGDVHEVKA